MVENKYGIAMCDDKEIFARQFLAKVADSLILVETIKAGFCVGKIGENQVGISARSLDEVNVQLIMEALGGGGHFNNSATQITGITINEAKERLIERFGLDDVQAQAIIDMRLRALTGLEREKLENEHLELVEKIKGLKAILADEKLKEKLMMLLKFHLDMLII
mgnify:CR=1 FL=1